MENTMDDIIRKRKKNRRGKKKIRIIISVAAVIIAGFFFFPKKQKQQTFVTTVVQKQTVTNHIQISGYIEAAKTQYLQSPGEGIIKKVNVKEGIKVKKGDLIFALDSSMQEFRVSKQEFDIAQEKINGSSMRLNLMQKELEFLKMQLNDRSVRANFNGVVALFDVNEGSYAKAQDNFGTIIDRSFLKATVPVSETDAGRLAVGQKVILNFPAAEGLNVEGKITAYPAIARQNSQRGNTVIDAKLIVENPPENILPGYSFSGKIIAGEDEDVLLVEQNAVFYEEGKPFVEKIIDENKTEKISVELTQYIQGFVKILSGVNEGDVLKVSFSKKGRR